MLLLDFIRRKGVAKLSFILVFKNLRKAIQNRIGYLTEDRKRSGLVLGEKISTNITLASLKRNLSEDLLAVLGNR